MDIGWGDIQNVYGKVLIPGSDYWPEGTSVIGAIINFSLYHYQQWSSRNIIEAVMIIIGVLPGWVWFVLDFLINLLIAYSIDVIIPIKNTKIKYSVLFLLLFSLPIATMQSSGWIATTMNYTWVVALLLYVYSVIIRIRREQENVKIFSYVLAVVAGLYAFNHEQASVFSLFLMSCIFIYDLYQHKFKKILFPFWLINFVELLFIVFCPGNLNRKEVEISSYGLPIGDFSFIHKVFVGVQTIVIEMFGYGGFLTILVLLLLAIIAISCKMNKKIKYVIIFVMVYTISRVAFMMDIVINAFHWPRVFNVFLVPYRSSNLQTCIAIVFALIIFGLCLLLTYEKKEALLFSAVLFGGAGTKVMLGFTTAWMVSGERTSVYIWYACIVFAMYLLSFYEDYIGNMKILKGKAFYVAVLGIGCILLLMQLHFLSRIF